MFFDYKKNRPWAENLQIVMQLGLTMAGCILFCFYIGLKLDEWFKTKGLFISIFVLLGVIGGAVVSYRQIMDVTPKAKNPDDTDEIESGSR
jgi:F0F1-type ATP synthase assembly protein I